MEAEQNLDHKGGQGSGTDDVESIDEEEEYDDGFNYEDFEYDYDDDDDKDLMKQLGHADPGKKKKGVKGGKGEKKALDKFQEFFHTINKRKDDEGSDDDFIERTERMLKDDWALRDTKRETMNGLVTLLYVTEWGKQNNRCHFHVIYKFDREHRRPKNSVFKYLLKKYGHVKHQHLILRNTILGERYINKCDPGSRPVVLLGKPLTARGLTTWAEKQGLEERLLHLVREDGIRNEASLVKLEPRLLGKESMIRHVMKVTKQHKERYVDRMYVWQVFAFMYMLAKMGDERTYLHFYDLHGNSGKSWFGGLMKTYFRDELCLIDAAGNYKDMVDACRSELECCKYVIVDASRSENNAKSVAKLVGHIMNGRAPATKYQGDMIQCSAEYVILLSNTPPIPGVQSLDRIICVELSGPDREPFQLLSTKEWITKHNELIIRDKTSEDWFHLEDTRIEENKGHEPKGTISYRASVRFDGGRIGKRKFGGGQATVTEQPMIENYYASKRFKVVHANPLADRIDPETGWCSSMKPWVYHRLSFNEFVKWVREHPGEYKEISEKCRDPCKDCGWNQVKPDEHNNLSWHESLKAMRERAHIDVKKERRNFMKSVEARKLEEEAEQAMRRDEERGSNQTRDD
ncbi:hypothetical protein SEMRO_337_G120730.1 [Seminavis robusta]|uniref:Uncharacterized protein n=1 Tax=Seminavis robusta TaxID=568900 RepID=A0A9N8HCZ0_9STRA|nr:hypothetical protein SEMRO_337_G120730.1 [Seminavis robusta]|eukprot:Sro337_g120730.1 n/a (631) ;mRNA; f:65075-66967